MKACQTYFEQNGLWVNKYYDYYRLFGGQRLSEEEKKWDRLYVVFNQKQWYFEDTKSHNSFVRIRNDHLKKIGVQHLCELDFYEVSLLSSLY